jgi:predicted membrane-bound mannosyltransferase
MLSTTAGPRQPLATPPVYPLLLITLLGFGLRLWQLDQTGLGYDEAATALMARATPAAIVAFHWTAAYEHPPVWQLLMHGWSRAVGQSEFALRLFPALAGVLAIPLSWLVAGSLRALSRWLPLATAGLVAVAPTLIYYSQEARMYTLVVALSLLVWWFTLRTLARPGWQNGLVLALAGAAMTLTHYYSLLATLVCGLGVVVIWWATPPARRATGQTLAWLTLSRSGWQVRRASTLR